VFVRGRFFGHGKDDLEMGDKLKRYDHDTYGDISVGCLSRMVKEPDGGYVLYEEAQKIIKSRDEAIAKLKEDVCKLLTKLIERGHNVP
jgi:Ca2+-binding EF-hand superfamily protein